MTIKIRKPEEGSLISTLAAQVNQLRELSVGSAIHFTKTSLPSSGATDPPTEVAETITAANATDLATVLLLANDEKRVINDHFADTYAHDTAVSAALTSAAATDQATANTLLNEAKADYNTHRSESNVHPNNDGGNAISSANATDLATSLTLANEIKTDANAHMALALAGSSIEILSA